MTKSAIKFIIWFAIFQLITYFLAGMLAYSVLGEKEFYPPSPHALDYLRDTMSSHVQTFFLPAQLLRGLLFAVALLPFRKRIFELGQFWGGLSITAILFIIGYVAASGGVIEHLVYFTAESYPLKFVSITLIEIFIQTLILGQAVMLLERKYNSEYYNKTT